MRCLDLNRASFRASAAALAWESVLRYTVGVYPAFGEYGLPCQRARWCAMTGVLSYAYHKEMEAYAHPGRIGRGVQELL